MPSSLYAALTPAERAEADAILAGDDAARERLRAALGEWFRLQAQAWQEWSARAREYLDGLDG